MKPETLASALEIDLIRATKWADALSAAMALYAIDSNVRQAAFLAQIGHESGRLVYVKELWGPTSAQEKYEGRKDLGNTQPGDGSKFRGRGLIQITGRANYRLCGEALSLPLVDYPELLEQPGNAAQCAAWFWASNDLNLLADEDDFYGITHRINGGYNGWNNRLSLWSSCKKALGVIDGA